MPEFRLPDVSKVGMVPVLNNKKSVAALAVSPSWWSWWPSGCCARRNGHHHRPHRQLPQAGQRSTWTEPGDTPFTVMAVTLAGETHRWPSSASALAHPVEGRGAAPGDVRGLFRPSRGRWTAQGNGAQFRVGVSDGRTVRGVPAGGRQSRGPRPRPAMAVGDHRPVRLRGTVGRDRLNTDPGPPNDAGDTRNDLAVWGEPRVIGR